ncbi:hypothetical protein MJO29_013646 [Puccinia striiformis f. sp. tritici]|nr:hypothetical protein MJO29_013646 [Puccinia striiformis f. sp. tritici]
MSKVLMCTPCMQRMVKAANQKKMNQAVLLLCSSSRRSTRLSLNISRRRQSNEPYRYNYIQDDFSQQEPGTLQTVISQFSNGSEIKLYSSEQLAKFHHPPRPSISLARDFIHDSLYNPNYGYFFNQVEIFDRTSTPTDNNTSGSLEDELYAEYFNPKSGTPQNQLLIRRHHQSEEEGASSTTDQRQIWHTPTELFKPWYAWSMAHYILQKHLKEESVTQKKKLKIYEIGAGNGTLCVGILDYIRSHHPSIYTTMEYVTIEVSSRLAAKQRSKIDLNGHQNQARVVNQSVLDPGGTEGMIKSDEECWILGMEVLDNLARDVIRYDRVTRTPLQSIVITDHNGDFHERFIPITLHNNPTLLKYLSIFNNHLPYSKIRSKIQEILATYIPFRSNLTPPEFVPTNYMNLLTTIFNCFPNHKIILSDFNSLPNSLPGSKGAPVVQTRYNGLTVPASTFLVKPGLFDIFFPTDFKGLTSLYHHLLKQHQSSSLVAEKRVEVINQNKFLLQLLNNSDLKSRIQAHHLGLDLNQIYSYYQNVKIFTVT